MCTADDSKLHSSIALHRTELLKSHSQELLLYSRNNILDSSKILHYFGEEFTIAWENSPNSHTKYRAFFFTGPTPKSSKYKIMLEYLDWSRPKS